MLDTEKIVVASDVALRDGIGIQVYNGTELIVEIFRDDTDKTKIVSVYKKDIPLEDIERYITAFKKEIPVDFIDYSGM